jgi:hypothetical protein
VSLYRQAGGLSPRALVAALLIGALIGSLAGFLAGRGSVEERSAAEAVADARAELRPVAAGLELVPIEYEGALEDGRVAAQTEYEAAQGAASRAEAALADAGDDMRAIDPAGYAAAARSLARLGAAIDSVAPPSRIDSLAQAASARVESLAGGA